MGRLSLRAIAIKGPILELQINDLDVILQLDSEARSVASQMVAESC